jgi:uncharacterized protein YqeY
MALKARIDADLKTALLGGDRFGAEVLRGLKAAILNEEVATGKRESGLADEDIEKTIAREVKKRHESAELYEANGRQESAESERAEAEILQQYLPRQLEEAEIIEIVEQTIDEMGATGMQSMGLVIGAVKQKVGNTADGATVARIVKEKLPK